MIDLHSHVLPGVDDGARDLGESLAMLEVASRAGVNTMVATPHIRGDHALDPAQLPHLVSRVREAIAAHDLPVSVLPGGEVSCSRLATLTDEELVHASLGGSTRWILLEAPYRTIEGGMLPFVAALQARGFRALVAHPERSPLVSEPELLFPLVRHGALTQVTAASLVGEFGSKVQRSARSIVAAGLAHVIASDAHGADARLSAFVNLLERLDDDLAATAAPMLTDTPSRLLANEDLTPDVPAQLRRRRWRLPLPFGPGTR